MAILPGDIILEIRIEVVNPRGEGTFHRENTLCFVQNKYLRSGKTIKKNAILNKLVCCGDFILGHGVPFRECEIGDALKDQLYHQNFSIKNKELLATRWKSLISSGITTIDVSRENTSTQFLIETKDWVMPVKAFDSFFGLQTDSNATTYKAQCFPAPVSSVENRFSCSPIYFLPDKLDELTQSFPKSYEGKLQWLQSGSKSEMIDVDVYLHPFVDPRKWHLGVWKHLLAMTPSADEKDKNWWNKLSKNCQCNQKCEKFPSKVFKCCTIRDDQSLCECDRQTFLKVNSKIYEQLNCYWVDIVGFFEDNSTKISKTLLSIPMLDTSLHSVRCYIEYELESNLWLRVALRGTMLRVNSRIIIHLNPITQHMRNQKKVYTHNTGESKGTIHEIHSK